MAVSISPSASLSGIDPFAMARAAQEQRNKIQLGQIINQYKPDELRIANALEQNKLDFAPRMSAADLLGKNLLNSEHGIRNEYLPDQLRLANKTAQRNYDNPLGFSDDIGKLAYLLNNQQADEYGEPQYTQDPDQQINMPALQGTNKREQSVADILSANASMSGLNQIPGIPGELRAGDRSKLSDLILNKYNADINSKNALANMRTGAGIGSMRYNSAQQKNVNDFASQLRRDNPDWDNDFLNKATNAYLAGADSVDGIQLPDLQGQASSLFTQIKDKESGTKMASQIKASKALLDSFEDIDIKPLQKFAGIGGRGSYYLNAAKMAAGYDVPEEFRDYLSYVDNLKYLNQDMIRLALGTSVVPDYVNSTLGAASNPGNSMWHDPEQVANNFNKTIKWLKQHHNALEKASNRYSGSSKSENNENKKESSTISVDPVTGEWS